MKAKDHYDKHLGNFYSWMTGNFTEKQKEQETFLRDHNITPFTSQRAIDLGAGHGLQSVSLAHLGFSVKAIDFNEQLLNELKENAKGLPVEFIQADIVSFLKQEHDTADAIVCMGDTLTHLETINDVEALIQYSGKLLLQKGKLVLSFRDLSFELQNEQRFLPVQSDATRIHTCFLEYFPSHVMIHDILHEKVNENWTLKVSAYPKLKITEHLVTDMFSKYNLSVIHSEVKNRMIYMIAEKQ